jgi:hypothetical protein
VTSIPTRPTFAPWRALLRWYYQVRIDAAEDDIHDLRQQPLRIAAQVKLHERCIAHWRVLLANVQD